MKKLLFNTGNRTKLLNAQQVCAHYGVKVVQENIEVNEIQSEDPRQVAINKAKSVYSLLKKPVVVSDDSWSFMGLDGFPGVYMHSVNTWLKPGDFLRLTLPLKDRRVILTQFLVYIDEHGEKIFADNTEGKLLNEIRGNSPHPSHTIISMPGDNGLSIAEAYEQGIDRSERKTAKIWHDFAKWYANT